LEQHAARQPGAGAAWFTSVRLRRVSLAVVGLWLVVCIVQQFMMGQVTGLAEKVYRDLLSAMPDPPANARVYVIHQSPLNSVAFTQALRLRYGRSDLSGCALSVSPTVDATSTDRVIRTGPDTLRIEREGGTFLAGFVERFHRFAEPVWTLADSCERAGLQLLNPPQSYSDMTALELRLPAPLDDPSIQLFYWDNRRISGRLVMLRMADLAELKRCQPASAPAAGDR
jgi:hypothetical protein